MNKEKIDDMDYYEKYLLNATKEERDCYIKEHPDFMNEYPVSYEHRELLQDKIYRGLMRKIRDYEKVNRSGDVNQALLKCFLILKKNVSSDNLP